MDEAGVLELASALVTWRVDEYIAVAVFTSVIYHYITMIHLEVRHIWPQEAHKVGKILFYASKASMLGFILTTTLTELPNRASIAVETCTAMAIAARVCNRVVSAASEAIFWLCLYALLGGKKSYFPPLVALFVAFHVSINVIHWYPKAQWNAQRAVSRSALDIELGYACTWGYLSTSLHPPQQKQLNTAAKALVLSKTLVTLIMTLATLAVAYRGQRGKYLTVIKREGAMFYLIGLVIISLSSLATMIGDKFVAFHVMMPAVERIAYIRVILADRLLLLLKRAQDPGTNEFGHSLVFSPAEDNSTVSDSRGSEEEMGYSWSAEPPTQGAITHSEREVGCHL